MNRYRIETTDIIQIYYFWHFEDKIKLKNNRRIYEIILQEFIILFLAKNESIYKHIKNF